MRRTMNLAIMLTVVCLYVSNASAQQTTTDTTNTIEQPELLTETTNTTLPELTCGDSPCHNGGTCIPTFGGTSYMCVCTAEWAGPRNCDFRT